MQTIITILNSDLSLHIATFGTVLTFWLWIKEGDSE